jgi:hypothetical protein
MLLWTCWVRVHRCGCARGTSADAWGGHVTPGHCSSRVLCSTVPTLAVASFARGQLLGAPPCDNYACSPGTSLRRYLRMSVRAGVHVCICAVGLLGKIGKACRAA